MIKSNYHNPDEPDEIPIVANRADAEYILNQTLDLAVYLGKIHTNAKCHPKASFLDERTMNH